MSDGEWVGFIVVLVVFWGLIAVIAKAKNRSAVAWILLSLLISPLITLVVIIFMGKLQQEIPLVEYEFSGEPNLSNYSYQNYLTKKYSIEKNEVLNKFIVGSDVFLDVNSALKFTHNLEKERFLIKKSKKKKDGSIECSKCGGTNAVNAKECRYCKHILVV